MFTYTQLLGIIDEELEQESTTTDLVDKHRFLPRTSFLRIINETLDQLVRLNPDYFECEYTYVFPEATHEYKAPEQIYSIHAYQDIHERWVGVTNQSGAGNIISVGSNTLRNDEGWQEGDELKMIVTMFPLPMFAPVTSLNVVQPLLHFPANIFTQELTYASAHAIMNSTNRKINIIREVFPAEQMINSIVNINIMGDQFEFQIETLEYATDPNKTYEIESVLPLPKHHHKLFLLEVKRRVYARKNKALTQYEWIDLEREKALFKMEKSRIPARQVLGFIGHGFGR